MFIRSLISVLIVTSSFILAFGQDAPEAKKDKEKARVERAFAFSFDGDGGYLGVKTQEVNKENFSTFGLREVRGVAVEKVMENSPAAAAGILDNDVIVRLNGDEITSTRKLSRLISEIAPDHQVSLTLLRNGKEKDIKATLGKRRMSEMENGNFSFAVPNMDRIEIEKELKNLPELKELDKLKEFKQMREGDGPMVLGVPDGEGKNFAWKMGERRQIGIAVYPLTKQFAESLGVESGVIINTVREDSPAAKAGLKAGDIIVEANGKAVKSNFDLMRAISDKKEGDVQFTIVRDKNRQTISVTPEAAKDSGFVFQTDGDEDGVIVAPPQPGELRLGMPLVPAAPMMAPGQMRPMKPMQPMTVPMPAVPFIGGPVI